MKAPRTSAKIVLPKNELVDIPLWDGRGRDVTTIIKAFPERVDAVMGASRSEYGALLLTLGDRATRRWLERTGNPYRDEIALVADSIGRPGAVLLNLSYEWTCTCGIGGDPTGVGNRMLRTLDWPMPEIGRRLVVALQDGGAGPYYNVTWPGFTGVLTAMAPGRFSVAINQPPMLRHTPFCWTDWIINRLAFWRERGLPPAHLLRQVVDTCSGYEEAVTRLRETPLCLPAFYTVSGAEPSQGCVIERRENGAAVHHSPTSIANHWRGFSLRGRDRGDDSHGRFALIEELRDGSGDDFSWVVPPILNPTTRIAVVANAARGFLMVQGWEKDGPATHVFRLAEPAHGETTKTTRTQRPAAPASNRTPRNN